MTQILDDVVDEIMDVFNEHKLDFNDGIHVLSICIARGLFIMNGSEHQNDAFFDAFFDAFKKTTLKYKASLVVNNTSIHDVASHA